MATSAPPIQALDEVRQLNALFLRFLRDLPADQVTAFGVTAAVGEALRRATPAEISRAAAFPRALFSLRLPLTIEDVDPWKAVSESRAHVTKLIVLLSARNLSRASGYWARLLLRLSDDEVTQLRRAHVDELNDYALVDGILGPVFDGQDWLWEQLLRESRPEFRRRLLLIGFQPDGPLAPVAGVA